MSDNLKPASSGAKSATEGFDLGNTYTDVKNEPFESKAPRVNKSVPASDTTQVGPHAWVIGQAPDSFETASEHAESNERGHQNEGNLSSQGRYEPALEENSSNIPYTVFNKPQRRLITFTVGTAFFFSPLSANIYFPCIPSLQKDLNTTPQLINLTITAYVIFQGVSPAFFGDLADSIGRRYVYIITFILYDAASLGLALQRSYAALLVLRMLQSAGCSATAAIGYGVIADVAMPSERGRMLGTAMLLANMGPSFGPLLGGILADRIGWQWVFWFLTILGGVFLVFVVLFFPETARSIVGNGSVAAPPWNRPLMRLRILQIKKAGKLQSEAGVALLRRKKGFPNPLESLRIMFYKDAALVLFVSAVYYAAYYCIQASMPNIFTSIYHLNELSIGISYLAIGIGVALGGYINGRLLDWNYRIVAHKHGFTGESASGDDLKAFPIEEARTRVAWAMFSASTLLLVGYGWALEKRVHISVPLILQFLLGFITTCIVQTFNTLLVDIFPSKPSTAAASGNITRCALSAGSIAAMQTMFDQVGYGWFFTILGGVTGLSAALAVSISRQKGMQWRKSRQDGTQESRPEDGNVQDQALKG